MLAPLSLADGLLAVQLDDELLAHRDLDVLAEREAPYEALALVRVELDPEGGQLATVQAVLARRIVPALDRALVGEAPRPFQEQLHALSPAEPALRVAISRHRRVPLHPASLGRPAAVVGDRRHVVDRADLQAHRLERPDCRFAPRARSLHEHLDLL